MNNTISTDKKVSQNSSIDDPIEKLSGKVIGTATTDNMTIRGRLIKFDDRVLWLEKMSGDIVMISRAGIDRIWISADHRRSGQQ